MQGNYGTWHNIVGIKCDPVWINRPWVAWQHIEKSDVIPGYVIFLFSLKKMLSLYQNVLWYMPWQMTSFADDVAIFPWKSSRSRQHVRVCPNSFQNKMSNLYACVIRVVQKTLFQRTDTFISATFYVPVQISVKKDVSISTDVQNWSTGGNDYHGINNSILTKLASRSIFPCWVTNGKLKKIGLCDL